MPPSGVWAGQGQNSASRLDFGWPLVNGCGTQFSPAFRSNPGGRSGGILQASAVRLRSPRTVIARIAWNMSTTRGVAQLRWPLDRRRKRAAAAKKEAMRTITPVDLVSSGCRRVSGSNILVPSRGVEEIATVHWVVVISIEIRSLSH